MELRKGAKVWLPCEVKPGPFSNERLVRVAQPSGEWVGFVEVSALKEAVEHGQTFILATVIRVDEQQFVAQLPGRSLGQREFHGPVSKVVPFGTVQA